MKTPWNNAIKHPGHFGPSYRGGPQMKPTLYAYPSCVDANLSTCFHFATGFPSRTCPLVYFGYTMGQQ